MKAKIQVQFSKSDLQKWSQDCHKIVTKLSQNCQSLNIFEKQNWDLIEFTQIGRDKLKKI
jgi:hypothetical protein